MSGMEIFKIDFDIGLDESLSGSFCELPNHLTVLHLRAGSNPRQLRLILGCQSVLYSKYFNRGNKCFEFDLFYPFGSDYIVN
ncbi:hypothetical protein KR51_00031450 [Rubidibacter lacunae KORDI 51-2]|uniref:Uncharacterized protein n=1 Tax=Rubidibacter lacunae KORDI 51-2 TaxID=582515 RepID=U5DF21_9CHRO|nr:hypothetical protein KR51_00031450 [Rubidibacter lacunae KORDI 51-2]